MVGEVHSVLRYIDAEPPDAEEVSSAGEEIVPICSPFAESLGIEVISKVASEVNCIANSAQIDTVVLVDPDPVVLFPPRTACFACALYLISSLLVDSHSTYRAFVVAAQPCCEAASSVYMPTW